MFNYLSLYGYTISQKSWLMTGLLLALASIICFAFDRKRWSVALLTAGGFCLFVFAAISIPFLNFWDERFHALVAKNCMDHPFSPTLYREWPIDNAYPGGTWPETDWCHGHVWLHKRPLFIWQIALCFKIFGVSLFTLRLPSVIMATLMIPLTYRIGSLLVDRRLGYLAALSAAFSWMLLDLVSGHGVVDHNNVCFFFYVTASLWAWCEFVHSGRKWRWVFVLAVLSGCAVLTKWLVGLLVYAAWGIYTVSEYRFRLREWKVGQMAAAAAITLAVFLPWQIYTSHAFPSYYEREKQLNKEHFYLEVENHQEANTFYLNTIPFCYIGDSDYKDYVTSETATFTAKRVVHLLLMAAGFVLLLARCRKWSHRITIFSLVLLVYGFFTLAVTKMPAYPFCICVVGYLSLGMLLWELWRIGEKVVRRVGLRRTVLVGMTAFFAIYQMNMNWFRYYHTSSEGYWVVMKYNKEQFKKMKSLLPERTILFNVRGTDDWGNYCMPVEAMFYTDALCYPFPPTEADFRKAKAAGYHIAILTSHEVPDYLQSDPEVQKVDLELWCDY
ncbi:MAG: glycosyltransferase family 39 protein [Bacteroidales bacterium]|nr:glycosyltransferase family 39 protein [Bacteroidales bacterium]